MKQFSSRIIYNKQICADFYEMALVWDIMAGRPRPGQFLTVRVCGDDAPLLRRPFAFAGYDDSADVAYIIYQKRGRGTEILSGLQPREFIDVIGPLGVPFPIGGGLKSAVTVAGGVGVGPILFLTTVLQSRGVSASFVFGCRSDRYIPAISDFKNASPHICTDDGSAGFAGTVVQYIKDGADGNIGIGGGSAVYACGPEPMLKGLYAHVRPLGAKVWVSMESMMACGVGACMGCALPAADGGYRCVCKDGPVFDGEEIQWEKL